MKKFDKTKTESEGYKPIYANNAFTMVNLDYNIDSMKALQGFCSCNCLPSGRIAKLQGGYYILTNENEWKFIARTLGFLTFGTLYSELIKLKN